MKFLDLVIGILKINVLSGALTLFLIRMTYTIVQRRLS